MKRRLSIALAAMSLVLSLGTAALWILSHCFPVQCGIDKLASQPPTQTAFPDRMIFFDFDSSRGTLAFSYQNLFGHTKHPVGWEHHWDSPPQGPLYFVANPTALDRLGLHLIHQSWPSGLINVYVIEFHYWLLLLIFSATATISIRRILTFRNLEHPVCQTCGYDLRATPTRCPECGTVPSHTTNHTN
jgi:hypothetical protein